MKKHIMTAAALLFTVLLASSCSKEYTCECNYNVLNMQGAAQEQYTVRGSKRKAEKSCKAKESSVSAMGVTLKKSCGLL